MKMLRKLLRLDNPHNVEETEKEIRETRARYDETMSRIEKRQHTQVFNHRDVLMSQWGDVMEIMKK